MAYDSLVTSDNDWEMFGHSGPFEYAGLAVYVVIYHDSYGPVVWMADWYDESWSRPDSSNGPSTYKTMRSNGYWCDFDGRYIHYVWENSTSPNYRIMYAQFDCDTNTYVHDEVEVAIDVEYFGYDFGDGYVASIARSGAQADGRIWVFYTPRDVKKNDHQMAYAYSDDNGGTWNSGNEHPGNNRQRNYHHMTMRDPVDGTLYTNYHHDEDDNDVFRMITHNGLDFGTETTIDNLSMPGANSQGCSFDNDGTRRICVPAPRMTQIYAADFSAGSGATWTRMMALGVGSDAASWDIERNTRMVMGNGQPMLFCCKNNSGYPGPYVWYYRRTGTTSWGSITQFTSDNSVPAGLSAGECTESGYAAILWEGAPGFQIECYPSVPIKTQGVADSAHGVYLF